jgi:hypothetical protein
MATFLQLYKHESNFEITINSSLKPNKNLFLNLDLMSILGMRHVGGANKVLLKIAYIAHGHVFKFLEGE